MGPLKGIRVLDLTRLLPGPLCTQYLSRLGASVIKLEAVPQSPKSKAGGDVNTQISTSGNVDYVRSMPPMVRPVDIDTDGAGNTVTAAPKKHGALFEQLNCGKLGLSIDMKSEKGMELLKRLIPTIDVVVESSRPGAMARMGFGYEDLKKLNPGLVYCSISGYGATGPYSQRAGHDMNYMALAGNLSLTGNAEEEGGCTDMDPQGGKKKAPDTLGFQAADVTGSMNGVIGILAALLERKETGKGQFIDVSMAESALALALPALQYGLLENPNPADIPKRGRGVLDGGMPNYRVYSTKDDKFLAVGSLEMHFWDKICKAVGRESDSLDTVEKVEEMFKSKTREEWMDLLSPLDACVEPVLEVQEVFQHPQHIARRAFFPGDASKGLVKQLVIGPKLSGHDASMKRLPSAPSIGQHTVEVLKSMPGGISEQEISELLASNTAFATPAISARGKATQPEPYKVTVEAGKTYFYCTCGLSGNQPFCDGKHKGTSFKPTKVVAEESKDFYFCGCRESKKGTFCDGSHNGAKKNSPAIEAARGKATQPEPYKVSVEAGKTYFYCTCGLSGNQPFCDGKHKGTSFKPTKVEAGDESETVFFCGCRQSKKGALCDGSHKQTLR